MNSISVQVVKAILTRKTDLFKPMDPYVQIKISKFSNRTRVLKNIGDMPEWNQSFDYIIPKEILHETLYVIVKDQDSFSFDVVGEASFDINLGSVGLNNSAQWHSLKYKKKPAGKIMLKISSKPSQFSYSSDLVPKNLTTHNQMVSNYNPKWELQTSFHQSAKSQTPSILESTQLSHINRQTLYAGKDDVRMRYKSTQIKKLCVPVPYQAVIINKVPMIKINLQSRIKS